MKKIMLLLVFTIGCLVSNAQGTYTVDPNYNHSMTLNDAKPLMKKFRTLYPALTVGNMFGKTALLSVLNQTDCVAIRFYNAVLENGQLTLVGVGVKADNTEITDGVIIERAMCCYYMNCFPCLIRID